MTDMKAMYINKIHEIEKTFIEKLPKTITEVSEMTEIRARCGLYCDEIITIIKVVMSSDRVSYDEFTDIRKIADDTIINMGVEVDKLFNDFNYNLTKTIEAAAML